MSQKINNNLYDLRRFQSIISKKIFNKFDLNKSILKDEWGWFVDPELNYNLNKNKYSKNVYGSKDISIPETIQEYPKICSIKTINNFHDELIFESKKDNKYVANVSSSQINYTNIVGVVTLISLVYILMVL